MLNNFDLDRSFWEYNPQLKIPFRSLYEADDSKNKMESSKILWAIALLWHPDSKFRSVGEDFRKTLIEEDFLRIGKDQASFNWDEYKKEIKTFKELALTKPQRFLVDWEKKLEERQDLISSIPYDKETYELLDKMMEKTDKMWKQYMSCLKDVEDEKSQGTTRGGAVESLKDQGDI